jgi:ABC-type bacteriocin/lantibiotic exporter with double-glycine peptidase domain
MNDRFGSSARKRGLQIVRQQTANDCGPACLTTVLHHFGKAIPFREVCARFTLKSDGVSALDLIRVARTFGLTGRGIKVPTIYDLRDVPTAAVLLWREQHFFVFEKLTSDAVIIMDPSSGRTTLPFQRFERNFSQIALVFSAGGREQARQRQTCRAPRP